MSGKRGYSQPPGASWNQKVHPTGVRCGSQNADDIAGQVAGDIGACLSWRQRGRGCVLRSKDEVAD
jgi:hypothetical protein